MTPSPELVFSIANWSVLPFWALLAVAPRWIGTRILVHSVLPPIAFGLTYAWLVATGAFFGPNVPEGASFSSLQGLKVFFTVPEAVVAGWIHYLVFDLFVGAWEVRDAGRRKINHLFVIPCLVLTLLLGPIGLLAYLVVRTLAGHPDWSLDEYRKP